MHSTLSSAHHFHPLHLLSGLLSPLYHTENTGLGCLQQIHSCLSICDYKSFGLALFLSQAFEHRFSKEQSNHTKDTLLHPSL